MHGGTSIRSQTAKWWPHAHHRQGNHTLAKHTMNIRHSGAQGSQLATNSAPSVGNHCHTGRSAKPRRNISQRQPCMPNQSRYITVKLLLRFPRLMQWQESTSAGRVSSVPGEVAHCPLSERALPVRAAARALMLLVTRVDSTFLLASTTLLHNRLHFMIITVRWAYTGPVRTIVK